jgi:hypothetical protein
MAKVSLVSAGRPDAAAFLRMLDPPDEELEGGARQGGAESMAGSESGGWGRGGWLGGRRSCGKQLAGLAGRRRCGPAAHFPMADLLDLQTTGAPRRTPPPRRPTRRSRTPLASTTSTTTATSSSSPAQCAAAPCCCSRAAKRGRRPRRALGRCSWAGNPVGRWARARPSQRTGTPPARTAPAALVGALRCLAAAAVAACFQPGCCPAAARQAHAESALPAPAARRRRRQRPGTRSNRGLQVGGCWA